MQRCPRVVAPAGSSNEADKYHVLPIDDLWLERTIAVNGKKAAKGGIEKTQPVILSVGDLMDIGIDDDTHVADYDASAKFNGKITRVTLEQKK